MATKKKELMEVPTETVEAAAVQEDGAVLALEQPAAEDLGSGLADESPGEELSTVATADDTAAGEDLDLNELLGAMDASEPEEEAGPEELTADEAEALLAAAPAGDAPAPEEVPASEDVPPAKPKRASRKKKAVEAPPAEDALPAEEPAGGAQPVEELAPTAEAVPQKAPAPRRPARQKAAPILTIETRGEVETQETREDIIWHEIHNAYRTRKILTGILSGIEQTDAGKTIAIVDYKGFRIVIPLKEMMINLGRSPSGQEYAEMVIRQNKILGNMLGAEIDFVVKGIESKSRTTVASRRDAMLKKRQIFYLSTDASGMYRIYENRIVQARVVAVAEKVVRVEAFGVECSIMARDLAWDWIGDAHERFSVGDQILVRILSVQRDSLEDISIKADVKSVSENTNFDNLKKCRVQSKYAGKVTDVHKGVVYIRLNNGVNAVAHSCYDYRMPGKKDDVSFAVTKIDAERGVAVGIITRIIRQNL